MVQELKVYFAALKRQDAREKATGARPITEGKEAIPYAVYVKICQEFFRNGQYFELLYATLCWNLMCCALMRSRATAIRHGTERKNERRQFTVVMDLTIQ